MKIKNWSQFQHFKDRRPPWIKLYRDILDDIEWHELDAKSAKVLVMLWLIASENDGNLPDTKRLAFRLRMSESDTQASLSKLSHWLEHDDNSVISERYQDDAPETETETEKEKETEKNKQRSAVFCPPDIDQQVWNDWIAIRKAKRLPLTPTAWSQLEAEAQKAGLSMDTVIKECCLRGWGAFKASWWESEIAKGSVQKTKSKRNEDIFNALTGNVFKGGSDVKLLGN